MDSVTATISIHAPRERVFEVLVDLANRPAFCDHFAKEFHLQRLDSSGVGAAARYRAHATGFPIWIETVIDEVEAPHRIVERGRGARADRMRLGTAWELVEGPSQTTRVTVTFWIEADHRIDSVRGKIGAGRWYRRQWTRALKRLRDLLESGEAIEPLRVAGASRI